MRKINCIEWYDTETSGINPSTDQIYQFASITTDSELNIIEGSEKNIICAPRPDVIAHPKAFLTHHLDMNILKSGGMSEFELSRKIQDIFMAKPNTCIAGFNSMSFDDVMVRNLFFRNMLSPYDHEWKDGNFRFDVYKLVQMIHALRPEILEWKLKDDGRDSLKLADISEANGIEHTMAHDALSDVYATIGLAKLIKERNGRAYDYLMSMTDKRVAQNLIDKRVPLLHVSGVHGLKNRNTTMIFPVVMDLLNKSKTLCLDLKQDPTELFKMNAEDIKKYLFTKRELLPENSPLIPAIGIQSNSLPIIMEASKMMTNDLADSIGIDLDACSNHLEMIKKNKSFISELQKAFLINDKEEQDAFSTLYSGGFISSSDSRIRATMHVPVSDKEPEVSRLQRCDVHKISFQMEDKIRHFDLLLRGKWNNNYNELMANDSYSPTELKKWVDYLDKRLLNDKGHEGLTIAQFREELNKCKLETSLDDNQLEIIGNLERHIDELEVMTLSLIEKCKELEPAINAESALRPEISRMERIISSNRQEEKSPSPMP